VADDPGGHDDETRTTDVFACTILAASYSAEHSGSQPVDRRSTETCVKDLQVKKAALVLIAVASMFAPPVLLGQTTDPKGATESTKKDPSSNVQTHTGVGVVTKIDAASNTVRLKHEPIKSLKWPSMTMDFKVKDRAILDKLAVEKKVEFDFVKEGKSYVVTAVR
jgi:Cu/Ag efflux protein CusF